MEKVFPVFCCYARKDQKRLDELKKHLIPLERDGLIQIQSDVDIQAGKEWEKEIEKYLDTAQIILLLLTPNFMASPYYNDIEMKRAIERHDQGKARVIPIIIETVNLHGQPFSKLQVLPLNAKPVVNWWRHSEAFLAIANGIREVIKELQSNLQRTIPITSELRITSELQELLNQKEEKCKLEWTAPFLTPHLLSVLFELPGSRLQHFLNCLKPPPTAEVQNMLKDCEDELKGSNDRLKLLPGSNSSVFRWEERPDVLDAQQLAKQQGFNTVMEEHLLLGVLNNTASDTVERLKAILGQNNFDELVMSIQQSLGPPPRPKRTGTNNFFRRTMLGVKEGPV